MIVSTYLIDGGLFGGFRDENSIPNNMGISSKMYENQFFIGIWNGTKWIEGATPEEIAEANKPIVPIQVKNMKFRLALIKSGIMPSSIDSVITQMPEGAMKENIFTLWNFADYLERNDASLNYMAGQFNITQEQLDNLFILSDTL